jgi:hypothetical protein
MRSSAADRGRFVTRYSMSDGRLFPIEIITAAIFAILIYSAFLQN